MKKKLLPVLLFVGVLAAVVHAHWRLHQHQEQIDFLTSGIKEMAMDDARRDFSEGRSSYRLRGKLPKDLCDEFQVQFERYDITATCIGCAATNVQSVYAVEYNRVLQEHVTERYGRDLVKEFFDRFWERYK
ncbi:MAG: hypothetical protein QGF59_20265 [Pirellulaceae bacterium]|jgi:hypothetical protein|nr:hypothetical protein [Pirellulaceae bacterium]